MQFQDKYKFLSTGLAKMVVHWTKFTTEFFGWCSAPLGEKSLESAREFFPFSENFSHRVFQFLFFLIDWRDLGRKCWIRFYRYLFTGRKILRHLKRRQVNGPDTNWSLIRNQLVPTWEPMDPDSKTSWSTTEKPAGAW